MSIDQFPEVWLRLSIGDVANVIAGGTPKASNPDNFSEPGTGISWLTPADLSSYSEKFIRHGSRDLSQLGYDSSSAKLMPAGSLLFSSRAPIGYVAIASNEISTNQGFKNFVFPYGIDSSYAYYFLKSIRGLAESLGTGTTFKEISGATAKTLPFLLPPIAEQKVIAEKLDTLLVQVESTKAHLELIPEILNRFRQSVLASAVSGKLTEKCNFNGDNYYAQLDVEISKDSKLKRVPFLTPDDINQAKSLFNGAEWNRWRLYPLELLVDSERGIPYGIVQTGEPDLDGIPTIRCGDVKPLSVDMKELKLVSREIEAQYSRTRLIGNEVILAIRGTVGNAAVITEEMVKLPLNISREVAMIPVRKNVNSHYIALLLQSPGGFLSLAEKTKGVAQRGINLADVKRLVTPLPSYDEQVEIVRRVEELFSFADTIEKNATNALELVSNLTQSILTKAFRGELTAEWRKENPGLISGENSAEALLLKIKAERENLKPVNIARSRKKA